MHPARIVHLALDHARAVRREDAAQIGPGQGRTMPGEQPRDPQLALYGSPSGCRDVAADFRNHCGGRQRTRRKCLSLISLNLARERRSPRRSPDRRSSSPIGSRREGFRLLGHWVMSRSSACRILRICSSTHFLACPRLGNVPTTRAGSPSSLITTWKLPVPSGLMEYVPIDPL
jgi:hypothetical protein